MDDKETNAGQEKSRDVRATAECFASFSLQTRLEYPSERPKRYFSIDFALSKSVKQ